MGQLEPWSETSSAGQGPLPGAISGCWQDSARGGPGCVPDNCPAGRYTAWQLALSEQEGTIEVEVSL